jgi:hypothetical protein
MGWSTAIQLIIAAGSAASAADTSRKAGHAAENNAKKSAAAQEQQFNKLNGKTQDGPSGTLLTGPQGIDPTKLTLGRNTLLGAATPTGLGG